MAMNAKVKTRRKSLKLCTVEGCKLEHVEDGYLCERHSIQKYSGWLGSGALDYGEADE